LSGPLEDQRLESRNSQPLLLQYVAVVDHSEDEIRDTASGSRNTLVHLRPVVSCSDVVDLLWPRVTHGIS
jgi:hypothetical protein